MPEPRRAGSREQRAEPESQPEPRSETPSASPQAHEAPEARTAQAGGDWDLDTVLARGYYGTSPDQHDRDEWTLTTGPDSPTAALILAEISQYDADQLREMASA